MSMMSPLELMQGGRGEQPQEAPPAGPNQPAPLFEIGPVKGIDLWRSPLQMQDFYLTDANLIVLDEVLGAITIAPGRIDLAATGLPLSVLGMDVFRPAPPTGNQQSYLFVVDGLGRIWQVDYLTSTAKVQVTLPGAWSSSAQTFMSSLNHIMLFTNGVNPPIKLFDSWSVSAPVAQTAGILAPSSAMSAPTAGAGGNLLGVYRWVYTYQNGTAFGGESSPAPLSASVSLTSQSANLSGIVASADAQVSTINIYRIGGSIPEFRFVAAIANGTTTYTDNIIDTALGQLLVSDRGQPPTGLTQTVAHKGRIFGFIGANLLFTNFNEPESWPLAFQLPVGDSSPIMAIGNAAGSPLFIWKGRETWLLMGESVLDFQLVRAWGVGCLGPRAWTASGETVIWVANDGVAAAQAMSGRTGRWIVGTPVWSFIKNLPSTVKQTANLASDGSRIQISFPDATPAVVLSLNFRTGDYERERNPLMSLYNIPRSGEWEKFAFQAYAQVPLFSGSDPGFFAFCEPTGGGNFNVRAWPSNASNPYLDLGSAVSWFFERKQVDRGTGMLVKRYLEVEVVAPVQSTGTTLTLTFTVDDNGSKQYTIPFGLDNGTARIGLPPNVTGTYCTVRIAGTNSAKTVIDRVRVWGWIEHRYKTISQYGTS